jgi:hypothetical protein
MRLIYATEEIDVLDAPSIFLAGPTPRSQSILSWRPSAVGEFARQGFSGVLLLPEDRSGVFHGNYDGQVDWEERALHAASCIMFWVPRSLPDMPGFTTNDEWGFWKNSGKVTWGSPPEAQKVSYQWYYARKLGVPTATTLEESCRNAIRLANGSFYTRLSDSNPPGA